MKKILFAISLILFSLSINAQLRLPKLISDGMILQRDANLKLWGWGEKNQKVTIIFKNKTYTTSVTKKGGWMVKLPQQKAGGPYTMKITSNGQAIEIKDILIGDVWVCSGQSNMELPMRRVANKYPKEVKTANNDEIRQFAVPQKYNFKNPEIDFDGGEWKSVTPENVLNFSAIGYFFAKSLYQEYRVPIGIINSSLGGSPVESWISEEKLRRFPDYFAEAQKFKSDELIKQITESDQKRMGEWYAELNKKDKGYNKTYFSNAENWEPMNVPGYWSDLYPEMKTGVVWYKRTFNVPVSMKGKPSKLILGRIVDADSAFINGKYIGNITYQYPPRRYDIPDGVLKACENEIVVRVVNSWGKGGFVMDKEYDVITDNDTVDLKGIWQIMQGAEMSPLASETFIRWKPEGLYNAMIAPMINYSVKGFVWYQGESNTGKPKEYASLLKTLINNWRQKWGEGNLPFIVAQLPNFMEAQPEPTESNWALLRESQMKATELPNTGVEVNIDLGEWNDIHPLDKKDVAERLALLAQKLAYNDKNIVAFSPTYKAMKVENNKIIIEFYNNNNLLLKGKGNMLNNFAISGSDRKFVWANAKLEGNKVIVWRDRKSVV